MTFRNVKVKTKVPGPVFNIRKSSQIKFDNITPVLSDKKNPAILFDSVSGAVIQNCAPWEKTNIFLNADNSRDIVFLNNAQEISRVGK
jgi:hypothetical protein